MRKTLRYFNTISKGFTLLELIFVIIIIGILTALALPRFERDIRNEAANNILSAIRYTRLMAVTDDVTNPRNNGWQGAFWRFGVEGCSDNGIFYYIGSDKDLGGNIGNNETINDPSNDLHLIADNTKPCEAGQDGASPAIFLTAKYGITDGNVIFCGNQNGPKYIGFDHLGRPHQGFVNSTTPDYSSILHQDCTITINFNHSGLQPINIVVEKGTGHAYIVGQPDS